MAIPKKGSRTITLDGVSYRWLIRRKATNSQQDYGNGQIHVAIELAKSPGTTLWLHTDRPHPQDWNTEKVVPITPLDISIWIKQALDLGWKPEKNGPQLSTFIEEGRMKEVSW